MSKIIERVDKQGVAMVLRREDDWRTCDWLFSPYLLKHVSAEEIQNFKDAASPEELALWEQNYQDSLLIAPTPETEPS